MIRVLAIAALLLGATPVAVLASEGGGGLINLDRSLIIQAINFALLLFILAKLLYKPLLTKMEERTLAIRKSLDEAQAARAEEQRKLVEAARGEAARLVESARAELASDVRRARQDLRQEVSELAITVAERLIRKSLHDEDHRRIVADAIARVDKAN